jgi:hypothetical protein
MPKPTIPTIDVEWRFTAHGLPECHYVYAVWSIEGCEDTVEIVLGGIVRGQFGDSYVAWAPIPRAKLPSRVDVLA